MNARLTTWWRGLDDETQAAITWVPVCAVIYPFDLVMLFLLGSR